MESGNCFLPLSAPGKYLLRPVKDCSFNMRTLFDTQCSRAVIGHVVFIVKLSWFTILGCHHHKKSFSLLKTETLVLFHKFKHLTSIEYF